MNFSPHIAEIIFEWANIFLVIALFIGVVSTYLIFVTTNIKEDDLKSRLTLATNKAKDAFDSAATANTKAASAIENAGKAIERAAKLEKDAAEARLETEKLKKGFSWRALSEQQVLILRKTLAKKPIEFTMSWSSGDAEGAYFAQSIAQALVSSGLNLIAFSPMGMADSQLGLHINGSEAEEITTVADALKAAGLKEVAVRVVKRKPDGSKYFTHIFVGFRTPPAIPK